MGIVVYAPALALSVVTGIDYYAAVLSVGLVCTFYSTLGGMKAVLLTDVFQSLLMFTSVFAVISIGIRNVKEQLWSVVYIITVSTYSIKLARYEAHETWYELKNSFTVEYQVQLINY